MANPTKTAKFKKKINGIVYDLNVISNGNDIVVDDQGHTVAEKVNGFEETLRTITGDTVPDLIAKVEALENSTELPAIKTAIVNINSTLETINNTLNGMQTSITEIENAVTETDEEVGNPDEVFGEGVSISDYINGQL